MAASLLVLATMGPRLGRPHVDTLKGSQYANIKELRFTSDRGVWRVAFAFDPARQAVILTAADKTGIAQTRFYAQLIAKADRRYAQHLERLRFQRNQGGLVRTLEEFMTALPAKRRKTVLSKAAGLQSEVDALPRVRSALIEARREVAAQAATRDILALETAADGYIAALRDKLEEAGGQIEFVVRLPGLPPVHLHELGDSRPDFEVDLGAASASPVATRG